MRKLNRGILLVAALFAAQITKADDALVNRIAQLEQQLSELRGEVESNRLMVSDIVREEVEASIESGALAQLKEGGPSLKLGKNIDGLKLKADLRVRYQYDDRERTNAANDRERARLRHRVRVGGTWMNSAENWEVALGLAAGSDDGNSNNATWNDDWDDGDPDTLWGKGEIYLDYAYAKHTWGGEGMDIALCIGKMKHPFKTTGAMFDGDYNPTGIAAKLDTDAGFFLTAGVLNLSSDLDENNNGTDFILSNMFAIQGGFNMKTEGVEACLALAYYHADDQIPEEIFGADHEWEYHVFDIYGDVAFDLGEASIKLYGQWAVNVGADNDNNETILGYVPANYEADEGDDAWVLGISGKMAGFKAGYEYCQVGGDSLIWANSDFGGGLQDAFLNAEGHKVSLAYSLTKNCSIGGTAYFVEPIETDNGNDDDEGSTYQVDLKYKF